MQYFLTSAALVASALAAPANIMSREAFELKQEEHGKFYKNGPLQLLSTYEKYASAGAVAPQEVKAAAAAQQTGSVSANPEQYDAAYLCPVTVGSSKLNLDFDTGSADLWVFSNETPASESTGHAKYNTASGRKIQGASWDITYGDQSGASGNVFADKVTVGSVTATSQAVEAATSVSSSFTQNVDSDGLLGLAFSSINTVKPQQQTTFFDTVRPTLQKALFTVDLRAGEAGSYTFGYIDSSKHSGSIAYVPVDNSQGFWQFTAGAYRVGGSSAASPSPSAGNGTAGGNETVKAAAAGGSVGTAIADTGTSLLYLPTAVVQNYYAAVRGATYNRQQAGYTFPCSASLPNFAVEIGGQTFTIPGKYINFAPLTDGSTTCFGGIQPDTGIGFSIFGDVFLKAVYAIFDVSQGSPRLGFAPKA